MADYIFRKRYVNHFGIDLKSSDLTRPEQFASDIKNAQFRKSGSIEKRKGYQGHAASNGGFGLFTYNRINPTTSAEEPEVLSVSGTVSKQLTSTLSVVYSGGDATALLSIFYDTATTQYRCQILEGAVEVLGEPLGKGFDEASPITIDDLRAAIDALTGFAATVTGATTTPAAFIKIVRTHDLASEDYDGDAKYWNALSTPVASPLGGSETNKDSLTFENVTATQLTNVMYFSNGYDETLKYDGQNLYRAGIPRPASVSVAKIGGAITGTNYVHLVQYQQIDAVGNIIEGNFLKSAPALAATAESFNVTVANIEASTGFNTNCAIVAGGQATINTITVDDGSGGSHTMLAGDTAYFFDTITADFITRNVDSVTATTITVDGAAVTVLNNAVISNNLRISIFRNETSGTEPTIFFLVTELPNDSFTSTQVVNDNTVDLSLGAEFIAPVTDRSPPPKGRYVSQFRRQMVIAGNFDAQNTVFYSDVESPEYFPLAVNQFDVDTIAGDVISGIAPNNEYFAVFKKRSIYVVSGDISDNSIRVDQLTNDIGCSAHATIQDVRGSLFFLSDRGAFSMTGGQLPSALGGGRLEPVFDGNDLTEETKQSLFGTTNTTDDQILRLQRAIGFNDRENERYLLFVPTETETGGGLRYANSSSPLFAFDYTRDAWLIWDNINAAGGITTINSEFYHSERRLSSFTATVEHVMYRRLNLGDSFDYQDNVDPIDWEYSSQWESLAEPSLLKRFIKMRLFLLEEVTNNDLMVTVGIEHNFLRNVEKGTFELAFPGGGYGVSAYGTSPYGNPLEQVLTNRLSSGRIRSLRLRFLNARDQENVVMSGWELEMAAPFRTAFKK